MEPLPLERPEDVLMPEKSDIRDDKAVFVALDRLPLRSGVAPREEVNMLELAWR